MTPLYAVVVVFSAFLIASGKSFQEKYYGSKIGKFSTHFHDVKGDVYAVDERTIFIKNFSYDGKGIDTYFWVGKSVRPDASGFVVPNEKGSTENLRAYLGEDIVLRLPPGNHVKDLHWLAVWSRRFRANFGSLIFPKVLQPPQPVPIGGLENTQHSVSSGEIVILDTQTFLVENFNYDGSGQGVYWWLSRGMKPNTGGLQLLDENHSGNPLRKYNKETVVVSVPEGHTIFEYDTLSIWSKAEVTDYGMVKIPKDVQVPPSARSLGIQPENKLNCEMLNDNLGLEARWVIEDDQLIMQLIANLDVNEYMALGFSKDDAETKFTSADAVVAWIGSDGYGHVDDYFLQSTEKCENGQGMCPDTVHEGAENNIHLLNAAKVKDSITVTFRRSLKAVDEQFDQNIFTDGPQAVLWAVGPVSDDGEPGPPKLRTRGNLLLDFGRQPLWNCPSLSESPDENHSDLPSTTKAKIHCPTDLTFRAQLGPSNKDNGPERIWYINGLPSPELTIQRGKTYTFIVEGGNSPPTHHPFYITSSEDGGLYQKILEANEDGELVFAGVSTDPITGALLPTSEGRICEWTESENPEHSVFTSDTGSSPALFLNCEPGNAGTLLWTPDANASDHVYYQSFTERDLGGKIHVMDFCEETDLEHYLEESPKRKDSHIEEHDEEFHKKNSGLEREDDHEDILMASDSAQEKHYTKSIAEIDHEKISINGNQPNEIRTNSENTSFEDITELFELPDSENSKAEDKILSESDTLPVNENDPNNPLMVNQIQTDKPIIENTSDQGMSESALILSSYPHDESERSDTNVLELKNSDSSKRESYRPFANIQRDKPHNINRNTFGTEFKNIKPPLGFNVQLEGGFVPLVINSGKEKESAVHSNYVPPPPHLRRPPRPFLFNESIPFHGTFKPGVPDFSGFNISHYTQDAAILEPNQLADHIALLSAPKPQIIQKIISPMNGFPPDLFRRPQPAVPRSQIMGLPPRPQMMHIPGHQQPLFFQLPTKPQPNFIMPPQNDDDDLDEVSSQRVQQISIQSPKEKKHLKDNRPGIPIRQLDNRNRQHGFVSPNMIPPSPPIQRRPDVVDGDDVNFHLQQRPQHSTPNRNILETEKQQLRPPHIQNSEPRRPQQPQRIPPNRFKNQHSPLPIAQMRPDSTGKFPTLFLHQHSMPRPVQQENPVQDNPFVYRLPNRPTAHFMKQAHVPGMQRPRYSPTQNHPVSQENSDAISDKLSLEVPDERDTLYDARPSQTDKQRIPIKLITNIPQFENRRPPPQIFYNRAPPQHNAETTVHDTRLHIKPESSGRKPDEVNVLNKEISERPPPLQYEHSGQVSSEEIQEDVDIEEDINSKVHIKYGQESNSGQSSGIPESQGTLQNIKIISVEKKESQEIHLPPLPNIGVNMHTIIKPQKGTLFESNGERQQNPTAQLNVKFEGKHEFPPLVTIKSIPVATEIPLLNDNIKQLNNEKIPSEHISKDHENVPFGARLKIRPQEENSQMKPIFHTQATAQRPSFYPSRRQPQFSTPTNDAPAITTRRPTAIIKDSPNNLYFNSFANKDTSNREQTAAAPKPQAAKEALTLGYPGRKNILPSDSSNNVPHIGAPPKAPENIKLPEISEKPPTHDNGTDYSILSHVMSLIGGQPQPTNIVQPRNLK